jgi:hypothetical protein
MHVYQFVLHYILSFGICQTMFSAMYCSLHKFLFNHVLDIHFLCFALLVLSLQLGLKFVSAQNVSEWFFMLLQMLAYLLLSASSAALSRNGVWMSRFGGDQFTKLINASASMAFLAFIALGLNSVISAYCVFSLVS